MSIGTLSRLSENGVLAMPSDCECCGGVFEFGGWRLIHGVASCSRCGAPYLIVDYPETDESGPKLKLTEGWKDAVSEFYDEFGTRSDRDGRFEPWLETHYPELLEAQ